MGFSYIAPRSLSHGYFFTGTRSNFGQEPKNSLFPRFKKASMTKSSELERINDGSRFRFSISIKFGSTLKEMNRVWSFTSLNVAMVHPIKVQTEIFSVHTVSNHVVPRSNNN